MNHGILVKVPVSIYGTTEAKETVLAQNFFLVEFEGTGPAGRLETRYEVRANCLTGELERPERDVTVLSTFSHSRAWKVMTEGNKRINAVWDVENWQPDCWPLAAFNPGPILAEPVMVTPSNLAARVSSVTDEEYRRDLARDILLQNPHSPKAAMQLADEFMAWSKTPVPEAPAPEPLTSSEQYAEASNRG